MIFKKIVLKNFMSYSNAEIDLSGIHVACLTGPNGAGKSSLLDAITWTIWEEGRARTDELIKLGQDEMSCEVEFFMESELFRVYRSRNKAFKNSQGKSNLEFQVFNSSDKNWISLTLSTTRQTQDRIIKTLKMDHPTFVNSVYLRQGKADEFTIKRPNERKQILADILELDLYDKLCELSKSHIKELEQNIMLEQNLISVLREKVLKEDELKIALKDVKEKLQFLDEAYEETKKLLNEKEKELNEQRGKLKQVQALEKSKQSQESLINTLEEQLNNIEQKEGTYKELIKNKIQIEEDYKNYITIKEKFELIEINKDLHNKLLIEKNQLEQKLREKIKHTEQELEVYKSRIQDKNNFKNSLQEKLKSESTFYRVFLPKAENEIRTFNLLSETILQIEVEGQNIRHEKELLEIKLKNINEKRLEIKRKIETLLLHDHSTPCPLCKSPIKDKEKVIESYKCEVKAYEQEEELLIKDLNTKEANLQEKRDEYNTLKEKIKFYGKVITSSLKELEEIRQESIDIKAFDKIDLPKGISFLASQIEVSRNLFEKTKEQVALLEKEINNYNQEFKALTNLIESGEIVKEISAKLREITIKLKDLKYEEHLYIELKKDLRINENIVLLYSSLTHAKSELEQILKDKEKLSLKITSHKKELQELIDLLIKMSKNKIDISALEKEIEGLKQKEQEKNYLLQEVRKQLIVIEQNLLDVEDSKELINAKESKIRLIFEDKKKFEVLEKAFGKSGIPIAIIETVVPEIEKEANRILNKLTDNQMHIGLRTQIEKKSTEGLRETLDVVIADNLGTRNYELYSGGEAFKIDFSLRLALSRLLVNRVGAKLQTLIIDEGFGSQDNEGKERLIEVIKSIESEFELILVVTHLDELKESFPTQIQVTKDEIGSTLRLIA